MGSAPRQAQPHGQHEEANKRQEDTGECRLRQEKSAWYPSHNEGVKSLPTHVNFGNEKNLSFALNTKFLSLQLVHVPRPSCFLTHYHRNHQENASPA
jgi:hypothetical protein